ncbi:uncharacterized protein LOC125016544 isoform X2 [Mugil cephalus]|uniref:uncharacterized protein LOC125016544 isoform X2 n=1 Tax=Mugil cephalus TaxID=48193 RepID=UPI001FB5865F|nr:uncharacterized protein LOC125016544 isoform X2 [Mugil cephalus]
MCTLLVLFLSTIVLGSVSAGGVYCAKTARARAAALGLPYPGVHGAPDLHTPAHHEMHPQSYYKNDHELAETEPNMATYLQHQPGGSPFDEAMHKRAHPRSPDRFLLSHGSYSPSEYITDRELVFPRGQWDSDLTPTFEEVKRVALSTPAEAPSQADLVNWDPQGRYKPFSFVYNEHDLAVDESGPNRHGMSLSRLRLPQSMASRGHGAHQKDPSRYVLGSPHFINKGSGGATPGRGPAFGPGGRIGFSSQLAQHPHRSLNVKPFVQECHLLAVAGRGHFGSHCFTQVLLNRSLPRTLGGGLEIPMERKSR